MDPLVAEILHDLMVSPRNVTKYPSLTVDYNRELFGHLMDNVGDYFTTNYTVCGAEDPAVIYINDVGDKYTELKGYSVVRVIDRFLNSWSSETLLEFSNEDITDKEYEMYEKLMEDEESL